LFRRRSCTPSTAEALIEVLATLSRDDTLFHCARTHKIVSGHASLDGKQRQEILLKRFARARRSRASMRSRANTRHPV
jgi:hypothetical protein